jgi:3-oxoacyl-[acyl-carrier-protein] synthase III
LFESRLRWDPCAGLLGRGHNVVEFIEAPELAPRCIDAAVEVARELLAGEALAATDIDVLVASQYPHTFAAGVARGLGMPEDRAPSVSHERIGSHTAGPIAALEAAISEGRFASARHVLFVTAGAGITIASALYRRQ